MAAAPNNYEVLFYQIAEKKLATLKARTDLGMFIQQVGQDDQGRYLELVGVHRAWLTHLDYCWKRRLKAMILAPFGHGKSSTLAVPLVAWMLGRDSKLRIKVITNDDGNAARRVMGVSRIFDSDDFRRVFPDCEKGHKWTDHELYLRRAGHAIDPSVQAKGVFGTGIGTRADVLLFDDVVDQKNSMDMGQRKRVTNLVEQTWLSRLSPNGNVLWIATPWHLDDATHHFMSRPGWCALVQRVAEDCKCIEQEVVGAGDDYPGLVASREPIKAMPSEPAQSPPIQTIRSGA
jgi:hypothetical protein